MDTTAMAQAAELERELAAALQQAWGRASKLEALLEEGGRWKAAGWASDAASALYGLENGLREAMRDMRERERREAAEAEPCPGCGCAHPSTEHLLGEYRELARSSLTGMHQTNSRKAQDAVTRRLLARGVTYLPNAFGPIPLLLWEEASAGE